MKRKKMMIGVTVGVTVAVVGALVLIPYFAKAGTALSNPYTGGVNDAQILLNGTYTPNTYVSLSDTQNIVGGDVLYWNHPGVAFISSSPSSSNVHFVKSVGYFPDGSQATVLLYNLDNKTHDNGYILVADQDVPDWVSALKGDSKYVSIYDTRSQTELSDKFHENTWTADWLPDVVALSGATLTYKDGSSTELLKVNGAVGNYAAGTTATPIYQITPTPAPYATVSTDKKTYAAGDMAKLSLTASIYAAATNWHIEALKITGSNGFKKFLPIATSSGSQPAADGTGFPYYGESGQGSGAAVAVAGGGSGNPSTPNKYNETAFFDTTNLPAGTYQAEYTVYDAVGRPQTNWDSWSNLPAGTITTTFTVTDSSGGGGGGGGGGGSNPSGGCNPVPPAPAPKNPYDDQQTWTSLGNGNERFSWVHHTFTVQTTSSTDANGCPVVTYKQVDDPTPMQKDYTASQTQGVISGLTFDPGKPGNMWLPISVADWNVSATGSGVWAPLDQEHGWTGNEVGGPDGSQIASTLTLAGQQYHTYGIGQGQGTPWAYARPGSGFGFRIVWTGSPHSTPTGGSVTYTMTNPDGSNTSWTKALVINTKTLQTSGISMPALNTPPAYANEATSLWADIPHFVFDGFNVPQLAAWNLSEDPAVVNQKGAHIDVTITIHTASGDVVHTQPDMVTLFSYPAWYMDHTSDDDLLDAARKAEQYVVPKGTLTTIPMDNSGK